MRLRWNWAAGASIGLLALAQPAAAAWLVFDVDVGAETTCTLDGCAPNADFTPRTFQLVIDWHPQFTDVSRTGDLGDFRIVRAIGPGALSSLEPDLLTLSGLSAADFTSSAIVAQNVYPVGDESTVAPRGQASVGASASVIDGIGDEILSRSYTVFLRSAPGLPPLLPDGPFDVADALAMFQAAGPLVYTAGAERGSYVYDYATGDRDYSDFVHVDRSGTATFDLAASLAIPEPGAWALMITGFGVAGAMLRLRRSRQLRVPRRSAPRRPSAP
jgi:hypothetical protein